MKKLIYSTLGLFLIGSLMLTGCKDDDPTTTTPPETPKPVITFLNTTGYTFTNGTATNTLPTAALKFGMVVSSTIDLKSITVTRNYNKSGEVVISTKVLGNNLKTFTIDILDTLEANLKGTYVYTFTSLDKDNTLGTAALTITATGPLFEQSGMKVFNNKGAGFGAFDLINGDNISTADASNAAFRDIVDNSTAQTMAKEWVAGNTTMFIKGPFTKQYPQIQTEADVKGLWDDNAAKASNKVTAMDGDIGMLVLVKIVRTGTPVYMIMTIDGITDLNGADGDFTEFTYKY